MYILAVISAKPVPEDGNRGVEIRANRKWMPD
jgi:hypothetical protein